MLNLLNHKDRVGSLLLLLFAVVYLRYAYALPLDPTANDEAFSARTLPVGLALATIVFALLELLISSQRDGDNRVSTAVHGFAWLPTLLLVLAMGLYSVVFSFLGFVLSSYLFLQTGFLILGERRLLLTTIVSAGLVLFLWSMLTQVFEIFLDTGDLYRYLTGLVR